MKPAWIKHPRRRGFALVITLALMVLLTLLAVGLLSLSTISLRASKLGHDRAIAHANARLGLMLALGALQAELGDDRRISADADILKPGANPAAVGVWNSWSPDLGTKNPAGPRTVDYPTPKGQKGFRSWLVSALDPAAVRRLEWHQQATGSAAISLFSPAASGFELAAAKLTLPSGQRQGKVAWGVIQENTKARINLATDESLRSNPEDQRQAPARPNLALSTHFKHPLAGWDRRSATIADLAQTALDPDFGQTPKASGLAAKDFTTDACSLLTQPVKGGLKVDLTTGFELTDAEFAATAWGTVKNPFRSSTPSTYRGQNPLYQPLATNPLVRVYMSFDPASVNHKFAVNGVPTFDTLRAYYRTYRHLYDSTQGGLTAFERPYSHIATTEQVADRPWGRKTHPALAPVLDRVNLLLSVYANASGELGVLLTPFVTVWNPHNIEIETEGLVVYPWIDFALFWSYSVVMQAGGTANWSTSLSRAIGEGYQGHGRSSRPYFYLHLTQTGATVPGGTKTIGTPIHLAAGEVRVFGLASGARRDLEILAGPAARTWAMKPINSATALTQSLKGGIVLNLAKGISPFSYKLQPGDIVAAGNVSFNKSDYNHIVCMADAWQIKNPDSELMPDNRAALDQFPALSEQPNLCFYGEIHSLQAGGSGSGTPSPSFSFPEYAFNEINENPKLVGSYLTYHRVAQAGGLLPPADLMYTVNPRQPFVNNYLSGGTFQTGPHYETTLLGGTSLASLAMETTGDGKRAYYGPSHSAASGKTNPAVFEIPRSPTLSLGSFQHCDLTATAFGCASQIANSWASPYLPANSVAKLLANTSDGTPITPAGLGVYDVSYLANESLFDGYYLSGAAPEFGSRNSANGSPSVWTTGQLMETASAEHTLADFFTDPGANPLRNPRLTPYRGSYAGKALTDRLSGPAKCVHLASHLMVEGGFNINSTHEEAWAAVLASLRGAKPAAAETTAQSRFRHILTAAPTNMTANDPWSGFRTLTDAEVKLLAKNLVAEIKLRGPFLSLGEFVNRRVTNDKAMGLAGAIQTAIDKSNLNRKFSYTPFIPDQYPNPENLPTANRNTGTNTPGWLSQADVLHALAPFITPRSDTFIVRSVGEATDAAGKVIATVFLEALVQRVPDWLDPVDDNSTAVSDLKSKVNRVFGRRFLILSVREIPSPNATPPT
ncbi:MAG: hypothetical protein NTW21_11335 [Verrucomicrobia bacterium]|nr:hypothetical protein [Verrucomicrobiota bacterium]